MYVYFKIPLSLFLLKVTFTMIYVNYLRIYDTF